ncbi:hypothetical protein [Photobacterium sp. OFAV2-7]|uniref:hypothetical protein n=1 Tax=Photobacterium sp. OFAV2-7 TaxID=2917748 RepID=UPI001EF721AF|nr:hypothetical protein [Photobacterium sp. OFAV2-7]MCG7587849.1 hypothetical protein [Photobacterium sp. OFAV2-7]
MANFVHLPSPSGKNILVNMDIVTHIVQSKNDEDTSIVFFSNDNSLRIALSQDQLMTELMQIGVI